MNESRDSTDTELVSVLGLLRWLSPKMQGEAQVEATALNDFKVNSALEIRLPDSHLEWSGVYKPLVFPYGAFSTHQQLAAHVEGSKLWMFHSYDVFHASHDQHLHEAVFHFPVSNSHNGNVVGLITTQDAWTLFAGADVHGMYL